MKHSDSNQRGIAVLEYVILIGLIAVVATISIVSLGQQTGGTMTRAGNTVADAEKNLAGPSDTTAPTITGISTTASGALAVGTPINFTVNFSEPVVTPGTPELDIKLGTVSSSGPRSASYVSGAGTSTMTFRYIVGQGDDTTTGIHVLSPLDDHAGKIADTAGNPAVLTFTPLTIPGITIACVAPTAPRVFVFDYPTNTPFSWVVPCLTTSLDIEVWGGGGGGGLGGAGGGGASGNSCTISCIGSNGTYGTDAGFGGVSIADGGRSRVTNSVTAVIARGDGGDGGFNGNAGGGGTASVYTNGANHAGAAGGGGGYGNGNTNSSSSYATIVANVPGQDGVDGTNGGGVAPGIGGTGGQAVQSFRDGSTILGGGGAGTNGGYGGAGGWNGFCKGGDGGAGGGGGGGQAGGYMYLTDFLSSNSSARVRPGDPLTIEVGAGGKGRQISTPLIPGLGGGGCVAGLPGGPAGGTQAGDGMPGRVIIVVH